jgi:uncharacterized repeat protein (TIGR01451 family)
MNRRTLAALAALAVAAGAARAQWPAPHTPPPPPPQGPAPLLFVRVSGPEGLRASFYPGCAPERAYPMPAAAGLRPGYVYRIKLSGEHRGVAVNLYPTLEVRGSVRLLPCLNPADFPAPVVFSDADLDAAAEGALVTKVVYLEHPERAAPTSTPPDQPLESDIPLSRDPMHEAWELGRPVLIVRLGQRAIEEEELVRCAVPGTVLLPGERALAPARLPPCLPYYGWQFYDPFLGPRGPEEECLHDGGDRGLKAGIDPNGNLVGVDPEDTVAEYTDSQGRRRLTCSNRVCLCTPRYAVLRTVLPLGRVETAVGPEDRRDVFGQQQFRTRTPSLAAEKYEQMEALIGKKKPSEAEGSKGPARLTQLKVLNAERLSLGPLEQIGEKGAAKLTEVEKTVLAQQMKLARELSATKKPSGVETVTGTAVVGRAEGTELVRATAETRDLTVCCNEEPCPPDKPLLLCKSCDRCSALPGDLVTFTLRYSNHGGKPITDVAVTDSLTTRLEYVPGSAQSDRNAVFSVQDNEAGSAALRWEIAGRLLPGESGVVRFKARVR